MHHEGFADNSDTGTIGTGAQGSVRVRLAEGIILEHVAAATNNNLAPVQVHFSILAGGFIHVLASGWVRGPSTVLPMG